MNIRGVGLMDAGGADDLTQGYHVGDIENVPLGQSNGVPVFVKDVAKVSVGYVPRLGKAGRDHEDDVVAAIVIMNRTLHTNDVVARVRDEIKKINTDGSLPPGVKLVPYYDRTTLVDVTTATVLHNLVNGCLLIFFIQWLFLGDLRSAIIVGVNIPFALFFSDHHSGAARRGRQSAVGRRHRFRHHRRCRGDPGRKYLSEFPSAAGGAAGAA